jgi:hypothetical protein
MSTAFQPSSPVPFSINEKGSNRTYTFKSLSLRAGETTVLRGRLNKEASMFML